MTPAQVVAEQQFNDRRIIRISEVLADDAGDFLELKFVRRSVVSGGHR